MLDKKYLSTTVSLTRYLTEQKKDFVLWMHERYGCTVDNSSYYDKILVTFHSKEQFVLFKLEFMK